MLIATLWRSDNRVATAVRLSGTTTDGRVLRLSGPRHQGGEVILGSLGVLKKFPVDLDQLGHELAVSSIKIVAHRAWCPSRPRPDIPGSGSKRVRANGRFGNWMRQVVRVLPAPAQRSSRR